MYREGEGVGEGEECERGRRVCRREGIGEGYDMISTETLQLTFSHASSISDLCVVTSHNNLTCMDA